MKRHLIILSQQFHKCLFLYYFLPPLFFFNISRDLKWVKMSFTLTHKRSCKTCHRSYIFEEPGTKSRFCCSIKHKFHSTNPELSPSAGTFLFLFPNLQAPLGCVLCTHHPFSGERKKPSKVHLTVEQREGTGWEMLASDTGKWEAKRELFCKVLWVAGSGQRKLCKTKKQEHAVSTYPCIGRGNRWSPKTQTFVK